MSNWGQFTAFRMRGSFSFTTAIVSMRTAAVVFAVISAPLAAAQADVKALLPVCGACHGADGHAVIAGMPSLAGQPKVFLENSLVMIREGMRDVPQMKGIIEKITDPQFEALAKHYAELPVKASTGIFDAESAKRGAEVSKNGLCGSCHLPNFVGQQQMPRLAGQREDFLRENMTQFRDGKALGRDTMMTGVLRGMTDAQLSDLAHYFATFNR